MNFVEGAYEVLRIVCTGVECGSAGRGEEEVSFVSRSAHCSYAPAFVVAAHLPACVAPARAFPPGALRTTLGLNEV